MSDQHLRRQLTRALRERDQAVEDARRLRSEVIALQRTTGEIPVRFATAIDLLRDAAYGGWRRPDDLGGSITGSEPSSRTPTYSQKLYDRLREERRWINRELTVRAVKIEDAIARCVDGETTAEQAHGTL